MCVTKNVALLKVVLKFKTKFKLKKVDSCDNFPEKLSSNVHPFLQHATANYDRNQKLIRGYNVGANSHRARALSEDTHFLCVFWATISWMCDMRVAGNSLFLSVLIICFLINQQLKLLLG